MTSPHPSIPDSHMGGVNLTPTPGWQHGSCDTTPGWHHDSLNTTPVYDSEATLPTGTKSQTDGVGADTDSDDDDDDEGAGSGSGTETEDSAPVIEAQASGSDSDDKTSQFNMESLFGVSPPGFQDNEAARKIEAAMNVTSASPPPSAGMSNGKEARTPFTLVLPKFPPFATSADNGDPQSATSMATEEIGRGQFTNGSYVGTPCTSMWNDPITEKEMQGFFDGLTQYDWGASISPDIPENQLTRTSETQLACSGSGSRRMRALSRKIRDANRVAKAETATTKFRHDQIRHRLLEQQAELVMAELAASEAELAASKAAKEMALRKAGMTVDDDGI